MSDRHEHPCHHDDGHDRRGHAHGHSHAPASFGKAFAIGVALNAGFVVLEVTYGLFAHSLALVADAGHNLSDVFGLLLAWAATAWARRPPTAHHTYGWRRSSILAALCNAVFLLVSVGVIGWEAVQRLRNPAPVEAHTMIWISAAGIVVNTTTALMFMAGRKGDLNVRAAFQHMAADAVISAGVVVAGVAIVFTGWLWLDPVVSLVLVAIIIVDLGSAARFGQPRPGCRPFGHRCGWCSRIPSRFADSGRCAPSPRVGTEHERDCPDRPPRARRKLGGQCASGLHQSRIARTLRHQATRRSSLRPPVSPECPSRECHANAG